MGRPGSTGSQPPGAGTLPQGGGQCPSLPKAVNPAQGAASIEKPGVAECLGAEKVCFTKQVMASLGCRGGFRPRAEVGGHRSPGPQGCSSSAETQVHSCPEFCLGGLTGLGEALPEGCLGCARGSEGSCQPGSGASRAPTRQPARGLAELSVKMEARHVAAVTPLGLWRWPYRPPDTHSSVRLWGGGMAVCTCCPGEAGAGQRPPPRWAPRPAAYALSSPS